ncbi:hypothetical protein GCM10010156_34560 [Planobispora rosea]|uniref:Uncharacterized protein n=1 Tax=Planobispora rosea TaxID=35762 RepID=A0A8J3S1V1_PLARO|nr:hypothetical protein GCM10010156_34560 [Planobispora rosea]GIH85320.1 hypothetical protein Pro02_37280 [Planobispora rosea]
MLSERNIPPRASGTAWAVPVSAACTSRAAASRATFRRRSRAFSPSFRPGTAGRSAFSVLSGTAAGSEIRVPALSVCSVCSAFLALSVCSGTADDSETRASAPAGAAEAPRSSGSARSG